MNIRRILLATDLSEASAKSYPYVAALARATGADITIVYADEYERPVAHESGDIALASLKVPAASAFHPWRREFYRGHTTRESQR